jgi:DNA-binding NarL/FixJ family response regulator
MLTETENKLNDTEATGTIRVLCVDDHPLVRKGIASILANEADMELVAEANNGREAVSL